MTHHSLTRELQQQFFVPLQLQHTFYADNAYPQVVMKDLVHGYRDGKDVTLSNPSLAGAAGAMVMNSSDIVTWINDLMLAGKVLSAASLKELMTVTDNTEVKTSYKPKDSHYGLGIYQ